MRTNDLVLGPLPAECIYVHVPFCEQECPYCDFFSVCEPIRGQALADQWLGTVEKELRLWSARSGTPRTHGIRTIYFGGGTPSLISPVVLERFLQHVLRYAPPCDTEITLEIQPGTATPKKIGEYARAGVNRFSIGVQTFDPAILASTGRHHSVDQSRCLIDAAKNHAGVSIDLICAWPDQTPDQWERDLEQALSFEIAHISVYELTFHSGTALTRRLNAGQIKQGSEDTRRAMFERTARALCAAGYEHYEISNYAWPGARSRHNENYWKLGDYLGLGAGAHSFLFPDRYANANSIAAYQAAIAGGKLFCHLSNPKDPELFILENLQMGLRLKEGIDTRWFAERFGCDLNARWGDRLSLLEEEGLLVREGSCLQMTLEGWLRSDSIVEYLL